MSQTRHLFVRDLLGTLNAPGTVENAIALVAQCQAEGGNARFNPLNCTVRRPGSTDYNSVPVQNYTSWAQGVEATASMLRQSNMKPLHDALMKGTSAEAYWSHLPGKWGTSFPKGYTLQTWLADVKMHWFARATMPISGT